MQEAIRFVNLSPFGGSNGGEDKNGARGKLDPPRHQARKLHGWTHKRHKANRVHYRLRNCQTLQAAQWQAYSVSGWLELHW